jgi:hypothetical protein
MLFLTFHPADWIKDYDSDYVTRIMLNNDVSLFFMIEFIKGLRIFSLLNSLLGKEGRNMEKQNDKNLRCYIKYLDKDNFKGWFNSIEGKSTVEVALINNPSYYTILDSSVIQRRWNFSGNYKNDMYIPRNLGTIYPISTEKMPVKLILNKVYKDMIDTFLKYEPKYESRETIFQVVMSNAVIIYIDTKVTNNLKNKIRWSC